MATNIPNKNIPSLPLEGRVAFVTGATSGIGTATAKSLAAQGAEVYFVCRNQSKGEALLNTLKAETGNPNIFMIVANLSIISEARRAAEEFLSTGKPLHLLVNNAGVTNTQRIITADGYEETLAINHLAYFVVTNTLLTRLKESAPARIVSVGSEAHAFIKGINWDDIHFEQSYKTFTVYGHSKLCNLLWTRELARKLEGTGVTATCAHPGAVSTGLGAQTTFGKCIQFLMKPFFKSPEQGAATSLYLATSKEVEGESGGYYANCKTKKPRKWATDDAAAARLWQVSEALVAGK